MGLFKRSSGIWHISYRYNGRRIRQSTKVTDKKVAKKILDAIKGQIAMGQYIPRTRGKIKSFFQATDRFEKECVPPKSSKTYLAYLRTIKEFLGDCPLPSITPSLLNQMKVKLKDNGESNSTINFKIRMLKRIFNLATHDWEWLRENPIKSVKGVGKGNERTRWLTPEEEVAVLTNSPPWLREIVVLALNTGLRLSELLSLAIGDIDIPHKTLIVKEGKGGAPRVIPLNEKALEVLRNKLKVVSITGRLFPYTKWRVQFYFKKSCRKAGIDDCHFHDLRHTFASRLAQRGIDLYRIQKLLGHKTPVMTQRYSHLIVENLRDGVAVL